MRTVKRYKLTTRYEISAVMVELDDDGEPVPHTARQDYNERLTIEDSFDLADAITLTAVLAKIDTIHSIIRPT